jgi:hypothetical protein
MACRLISLDPFTFIPKLNGSSFVEMVMMVWTFAYEKEMYSARNLYPFPFNDIAVVF